MRVYTWLWLTEEQNAQCNMQQYFCSSSSPGLVFEGTWPIHQYNLNEKTKFQLMVSIKPKHSLTIIFRLSWPPFNNKNDKITRILLTGIHMTILVLKYTSSDLKIINKDWNDVPKLSTLLTSNYQIFCWFYTIPSRNIMK